MKEGLAVRYELKKAEEVDIEELINYKLQSILPYTKDLSKKELDRINAYVKKQVPIQLVNYKIIYKDHKKIGCLLIDNKDDGILLDEIYLNENYRNKGIGTDIIKKAILKNNIVYLWVYKLNVKAIALYKKLGFQILVEAENRYFMKYDKDLYKIESGSTMRKC